MKLLISDFDNTFYQENCFEKNIEALHRFLAKGNMFAIATGRSFERILPILIEYKIPFDYLITHTGSLILDNNGSVLDEMFIDKNTLEIIKNILIHSPNIEEWTFSTKNSLTQELVDDILLASIKPKENCLPEFYKEFEFLTNIKVLMDVSWANIIPNYIR